jgi:hypothetical protein
VRRAERAPRYAVGQFPVSGDYTVDRLDGPRKIAERDARGNVLRFETREEAEAHLAAMTRPLPGTDALVELRATLTEES